MGQNTKTNVVPYNRSQYKKNLRLTKAKLVEFAERTARSGRISLKRKATKAELAAFLALFDPKEMDRDPNVTEGPQDPNCHCAICEARRERNAEPWSMYEDDWSPRFKKFLENI